MDDETADQLWGAAQQGRTEEVCALLSALDAPGADAVAMGKAARVAARVAAVNDHVDCLSALWPMVRASSRDRVMYRAVCAGSVHAVEFLLSAKADVGPSRFSAGFSHIGFAIKRGHVDVLQVLLRAKAPRDWRQDSCLRIAIENRDEKALDVLLDLGGGYADVPDLSGNTPLVLAAMKDEPRMVSALLSAKADAYRFTCQDALFKAVTYSASSIELLLRAKACVDRSRGPFDMSPLHQASSPGVSTDAVLALFRAKANVNVRDAFGRVPLHYAARRADAAVAGMLLEAKAVVHTVDLLGVAPVHWAVKARNCAVLELLLQFKADPNHVSRRHASTPLVMAVRAASTSAATAELAHLLSDHMQQLGQHRLGMGQQQLGRQELEQADADQGALHAVVKALLSAKADVAVRDSSGHTPLEFAEHRVRILARCERISTI
jgi:ankyrin repeat protein